MKQARKRKKTHYVVLNQKKYKIVDIYEKGIDCIFDTEFYDENEKPVKDKKLQRKLLDIVDAKK